MAQDQAMGALPQIRASVDPSVKGGEYYGPDGRKRIQGLSGGCALQRSFTQSFGCSQLVGGIGKTDGGERLIFKPAPLRKVRRMGSGCHRFDIQSP